MYATPSLAGSLFRIANFCDPEVVMERLEETGRYNDLIDFLHGKKLHRQALEILQRFGQEESGLLAGPTRTVGYLQNLPPDQIDLILEFAEWPIRENHDLGMEIFLAETENAETLPRSRVLGFLEKIDVKIAVRYLEHVIHEWNDLSPDLHQRLLMLYLDRINAGQDESMCKEKFLNMLKESEQYSPAKILDRLNRDGELFFLFFSGQVNAPSPFDCDFSPDSRSQFPRGQSHCVQQDGPTPAGLGNLRLQVERSRQGRRVRLTLFNSSHSTTKFFRYCNQVHLARSQIQAEDEKEASIYLTLLSLYLTPPHGYQPQNGPALAILAKHGSRLPAEAALKLIPATLPVRDLEFYFKGRMRAANTVFNEARIVASLRKTRDLQVQAQLALGEGVRGGGTRARHVNVTEERICGVCHKRLGGSVINVFPEYVHHEKIPPEIRVSLADLIQ